MKKIFAFSLITAIAACSNFSSDPAGPSGSVSDGQVRPPEMEPSAPPQKVSAGASLGITVATLGDATQQGIWLKTPLVSTAQQGILVSIETGQRVQAELIPIPGEPTAGSRISLQGMRALGLPLTALAQIEVRQGV